MWNIITLQHLKLDLTSQCNQKCEFCPYHWCGSRKIINKKSILNKKIIQTNIFDWFNSFKSIQISGSWEWMLHPNFEDIVEFIRTKVANLRIITNWTIIKKHTTCIIENFDNVLVSLHGNEQTHEKIVRTKWVYKKTIWWILLLKELNFKNVKIHYVLTQKNIWDVPFIIDFSRKHDVPIIFALDFLPDITKYPNIMFQLFETMNYIRENNFTINPNLNNNELEKFFTQKDYIINPFYCNHRNEVIEIVSNWDVYVCRSKVFGNINIKKLLDIVWNSKRIQFLKDVTEELNWEKWLSDPRCNRCCYQRSPKHKQP